MSTPSPSPSHPKAFISHASADRAFVERFAADLRANGVDAWYSGWEMKAGDSIRAKIDEGLRNSDVFIIVLSKASINRAWVQTELDAATVRKLDGKAQKIVPVRIDECGELPPILGSLVWEDFSNRPYDVAFKGVLNSVFAVDTKPPIGTIPDLPPIVTSRTTFGSQQRISTTAAIFWAAVALAVLMIASKLTINIGLPPWIGQVVGGAVLAGIVWLFFERVEAVLEESTRIGISCWLVGRSKWKAIERHQMSRKLLQALCGRSDSTRRAATIFLLAGLNSILTGMSIAHNFGWRRSAIEWLYFVLTNVVVGCVLALNERFLSGDLKIGFMFLSVIVVVIAMSIGLIAMVAWVPLGFDEALRSSQLATAMARLSIVPILISSLWMWLPTVSGMLVSVARRFDLGFDWFNRHFDIERRPLSALGLVAGALVAFVYWAAVIVARFV